MSPSNLSLSLSASSFINSICTCIILYPILMLKASISPCLIHQGIESTESTEAPVRPPVPCRSRPWPAASGSPAASAAAVAPPGSPRRSVALSHRRWAAWCCRWSRSWWDQGWAVACRLRCSAMVGGGSLVCICKNCNGGKQGLGRSTFGKLMAAR